MSNIFRDSESLGKSSGKKWSQIWTFLFGSSLKLPNKKNIFLADFAFCFSKNLGLGVFLVQQNMVETPLPDGLETSGRRAYRKFWHISRHFWVFIFWMIFSVFQKNWVLGYSWSTLLWYRCYYLHWSSEALSPICGNFPPFAHLVNPVTSAPILLIPSH